MSASLVGSEMCIRDRCKCARVHDGLEPPLLDYPLAPTPRWLKRKVRQRLHSLTFMVAELVVPPTAP
eukprot:6969039-Alexandrium_andersonii.AAC.1